jgi:hypothetical protein
MITASGHICIRRRPKDGHDGTSIEGQIIRITEWQAGTEYHNDSKDVASPRFLDVVTVTTGLNTFTAWQCIITHTSSTDNQPQEGSSYWTPYNMMNPIYTSMIIAANAVLRFAQTNQLLVMKSDGTTINVGLGGGDYPIWVGAVNPTDAKFHVDADGRVYAEDGTFKGQISASSGLIGGFFIKEDSDGHYHLYSTHGTLNGAESDDYTNADFVPAIDLDGSTGTIKVGDNVTIDQNGLLQAISAQLEGATIFRTVTKNGVTNSYYLYFDTDGNFWIGSDLHTLNIIRYTDSSGNTKSRIPRYYAGDIWCASNFGHLGRNYLEVRARLAYFKTTGETTAYSGVQYTMQTVTYGTHIAKVIPLYGTATDDASGYPVDVILFAGDLSSVDYVLGSTYAKIGKKLTIVNTNDSKSTHMYINGTRREISGGEVWELIYVGTSYLSPAVASSPSWGEGWLVVSTYDNTWY